MYDAAFWSRLEFELSGWLSHSADPNDRRFWIDGFEPDGIADTRYGADVEGSVWMAQGGRKQQQFRFRVSVPQAILLGFTVAIVAFVEFIQMVRHARTDVIALASFAAVFLACGVVGWRSYPYWATGVYQVGIGAFPPMDQDPKRLIPMIWIGEFWRLPVLLLYLFSYVTVPALSVAVIVAFWRRRFVPGITTAFCVDIVVIFMLGFSPDYVTWLMD